MSPQARSGSLPCELWEGELGSGWATARKARKAGRAGEADEPEGTLRIPDLVGRRRAVSLVLTMKNILISFGFYIHLW